jgi:hypothetical protein
MISTETEQSDSITKILAVIAESHEDADHFAETLRHRRIPHLSFSQITAVEFCPYRYYLEYIKLVELDPVPLYFTKGKLLHQIIASVYQKTAAGEPVRMEEYEDLIDRELEGDHRSHLRNAITVHFDHRWADSQVVSIEKPFVMDIGAALPPCVGVIDLVLKKDSGFILIDHKTGHSFYPEDELQMAIYVEYMRRQFGEVACQFYYEHYRWVNHLGRIRKPAFQRNQVSLPASSWTAALERIRAGYRMIEQIQNGKRAEKIGECFRCPYRGMCWK